MRSPFLFYCILVVGVLMCIGSLISAILEEKAISEQRVAWEQYRVPLPKTKFERNYEARITPLGNKKQGESTFDFQNPSSDRNTYVRFVSSETGDIVADAFVRVGEAVKVTLPYGWYEFRCAAGHEYWYGKEKLFGRDTKFTKSRVGVSVSANGAEACWRTSKRSSDRDSLYMHAMECEFFGK